MARENGHAPKILPEKKAIRARPPFLYQLELKLFPPLLGVRAFDAAWPPDSGLSLRGTGAFWGRIQSRERSSHSEPSQSKSKALGVGGQT